MEKRHAAWDYAQADAHDRDIEPDGARLSEAVALLGTDSEQALTLLRSLADAGSAAGADAMGEAYLRGLGVTANRTAAQHWFKTAFERGSLRGMLHYGGLLVGGGHLDEAEAVFATGLRDGWAPALCWTARIQLVRSGARALPQVRPLLERATAAGSPAARTLLMGLMISGRYGLGSIPKGLAMAGVTFESVAYLLLLFGALGFLIRGMIESDATGGVSGSGFVVLGVIGIILATVFVFARVAKWDAHAERSRVALGLPRRRRWYHDRAR